MLARVEVPSAIWRKERVGELDAADAAALVEAFEWDWHTEAFAIVPATDEILEAAARTVARHPLRAYDAVQLATASVARAADADLTAFACFDDHLGAAARTEGFRIVQ